MFKKLLLSIASVMALGALNSSPVLADTTMGGENCKPANLRQALNLGLGWSQFGVTNNASSGGFFVICPLNLDTEYDTFDTMEIEVQYLDPGAGNISCTILEVETQSASPIQSSVALGVDPNPGNTLGQYEQTNVSTVTPSIGTTKAVMICILPAQTRIAHYNIDGS